MNMISRLRAEEERLAEAFPAWICRAEADESGSVEQGPFVVTCRKALPTRPPDVADGAADDTLSFSGTSWDDAFRQAESGLEPCDQGAPGFG